MMRPILAGACGAVLSLCLFGPARVHAEPAFHVTDGAFTSSREWTGPDVSKQFFPVDPTTGAGGAYLYVEQGSPTIGATAIGVPTSPANLYLLYDYVNSGNLSPTHSFFDVFFQVNGNAPEDYLVRIMPGTGNFESFERPVGSVAPLNADGTFNIGQGSGWSPLTAEDLALARFQTAIGFGPSPDDSTPHLIAEFQLSINNQTADRNGSNGLYDPSPAFWSASADAGDDPPISSAIFQLNPNGTTTVAPVLGPTGGPVKQASVPEPSSLAMLGVGLALMGLSRAIKGLGNRPVRAA